MTITLIIPGKPVAWQRPRHSGKTGAFFTAKPVRSYCDLVALLAREQFPTPIEGPVVVTIKAQFEIPKSWSKKKAAEHIYGPHCQRPDLDNLQKAILDGLNRIAFADDAQVYEVRCRKVWAEAAKTIVTIQDRLNVPLSF